METTMSFDLSKVPAKAAAFLSTLPEEQRADAWELLKATTVEIHAAAQASAKKMREQAAKDAADNREKKRESVQKMCDDIGIEYPSIVKSLHQTHKKVKTRVKGVEVVKVPQVLCGLKFNIEGISGSLDLYISTGKGAKVTPKTEVEVEKAQALALRIADTLVQNGFTAGEEDPESDETTDATEE